mgnify:CR=1 FL=1
MRAGGQERGDGVMPTLTTSLAIASRDLSSERAAGLIVEHSKLLLDAGWRLTRWTPYARGSPFLRKGYAGYGYFKDFIDDFHHAFDHPYRLVNKTLGRVLFCAEPYGVSQEAIKLLSSLDDDLWHYWIDTLGTIHYPGWTVRICVERRMPRDQSEETA